MPSPGPPIAKVVPKEITVHGDTRVDPYFWLRDRKDPDTIAYLEAENQYTEAQMKEVKEQRAKGEEAHKAGKHQEAVDELAKAKKTLGIKD